MGIKDFFEQRRKRRTEGAIVKHVAKLTHKHRQDYDRYHAADKLSEIGTPEAIMGLLQRFSIQIASGLKDEKEKQYVFELLVAKGEQVVGPVLKYLREGAQVSWPLKVLGELLVSEAIQKILVDLLSAMDTSYERDPARKMQLLTHIAEFQSPDVAKAVAPFLDDQNETVRFLAVSALGAQEGEEAREPLLTKLIDPEEESLRIRIKIAEVFHEKGWKVKGARGSVEAILPEGFFVDKSGYLKERGRQRD